uniref:F-box domain-containing protein n=1 Tax=Opuntia streptacantha TaxID=393608 RepID=A0A7C9F8R2_OPUST
MEQMSWKTRSPVEDGVSPKKILRQKSHRKLLSGLKVYKTVRANTSDTATDPWKNRRAEVSDDESAEVSQQQDLPHDLIAYQILTRLPIKSLLQYKSVSKEWYSTISSYAFANARFRACLSSYSAYSPIECLFIQAENCCYLLFYEEEDAVLDYYLVKLEIDFNDQNQNEIQLVGSCNGLVCLAYSSPVTSYFYIWNPITHYWCKFIDPYLLSFNYRTSWGFGYISSEDDYKIVRLIQDFNNLELIVHVFSLCTQKWKRVHDHGLHHSLSLSKTNPGVLVGETLYWFMDTGGSTGNPMVVGFITCPLRSLRRS